MATIRLTARARRDLEKISEDTRGTHGRNQVVLYRQVFQDAFSRLAELPQIGVERPDIKPDYRSLVAGHHFILYRIDGDFIDIVAIRHQREDLSRKENEK